MYQQLERFRRNKYCNKYDQKQLEFLPDAKGTPWQNEHIRLCKICHHHMMNQIDFEGDCANCIHRRCNSLLLHQNIAEHLHNHKTTETSQCHHCYAILFRYPEEESEKHDRNRYQAK